jgi:hypothetical protein
VCVCVCVCVCVFVCVFVCEKCAVIYLLKLLEQSLLDLVAAAKHVY